ncbi:MAG: hypothetical protein KAS78_06140, partial [Candidatus Pacebacteria bacterium]|nr:hypothetical protein [Candidatus Paceibacterota bacterium]
LDYSFEGIVKNDNKEIDFDKNLLLVLLIFVSMIAVVIIIVVIKNNNKKKLAENERGKAEIEENEKEE